MRIFIFIILCLSAFELYSQDVVRGEPCGGPLIVVSADTSCKFDSLSLLECNCEQLKIVNPKINSRNSGVFDGPGTCAPINLYNWDKKISKCGFFYDNRLIYGLAYYYDSEGNLSAIKRYYKGKYIGNCDPPKIHSEEE